MPSKQPTVTPSTDPLVLATASEHWSCSVVNKFASKDCKQQLRVEKLEQETETVSTIQ